MPTLTPQGQRAVEAIAERHGFGVDAATEMLDAVILGRGGMAQFNHQEFGGSGQWMRGGMTMVSDMFNDHLKGRVNALCQDLADLAAEQPDLLRAPTAAASGLEWRAASLGSSWWPASLGTPSSVGSQNDMRYAYFPERHRLAVDTGGRVSVYDTADHRISGFSQQQSSAATIAFSSQHGPVRLDSLRRAADSAPAPSPAQSAEGHGRDARAASDVLATIERLGELKAKGVLSEQEFSAKKIELLQRL